MQTQRLFWKGFRQYNVVNFVVSSCIIATLIPYFADVTLSAKVEVAQPQHVVLSPCVHPVSLESVQSRQSSKLATQMQQYSASRLDVAVMEGKQRVRQSDADLNVPYTNQRCIPGDISQRDRNVDTAYKMSIAADAPVVSAPSDGPDASAQQAKSALYFVAQQRTISSDPSVSATHALPQVAESSMPLSAGMLQGSADNVFPYGQCTWWANQRYFQLHQVFVPWRTNANAFQWVARAIESGWHVSGIPIVGSIMVLQPGIGGAYGLGHVGVVEQILTDGRVIVSSMNWGNHPDMVTQASYVLTSGVSFISATGA